jgi:glycosyltransferase involved in cell wall biosynthesis/peptidoglycan/xylan/chitin deacetylase (PgdA/CDA1 family)
VWLLSREQARLGHEVSLLIDTPPAPAAIEMARDAGVKLIHVHATYWSYPDEIRRLLHHAAPDLVHMHSVFIIRQATLARVLKEMQIPYIITPHGGLAPQVLRRGIVKKTIYTLLRERPRFMNASAVALVTPAEERAVRSFIPHYHRPVRWMPNPVEVDKLEPHRWQGVRDPNRLVFLGRFDVLVKGIDILIEIARALPGIKVDLYGTEDPKTLDWLNRLRRNLPENVSFNAPIFGAEKAKMLSQASFYLQPSRWEGFPVSVAECLYLGVPCIIADTLDLAQLFYQNDLGLVIPLNPAKAAAQIRAAVSDRDKLAQWSQRGRQFAIEHFHPSAVARKHLRLYQEVLDQHVRTHTLHSAWQSSSLAQGANSAPHARPASQGWRVMPAHVRGAMKENVSRAFERSSEIFATHEAPRTIVLCYHSINNAPSVDLAVDPAVFREQILLLKALGFQFVNFGQLVYRLLRWGPPKGNVACVTFDDGYLDNLTQAAPILADLKVPATTFITSGLLVREPAVLEHFRKLTNYPTAYLDARSAAQLHSAGFEIGAHTHSHANLARLDLEETRDQVLHSRRIIEDAIAAPVRSFAYPFGKRGIHYTPETVTVVREAGFHGAAAVAFRSVTARESIRVFEVPRFFVNRSDTLHTFEQKVKGHFDWLGSIQEGTPRWLKAMVSPEDRY